MLILTRVGIIALALTFAAWPARAQVTTGSIVGQITDEQGGAIPGAVVEAVNSETGFVRSDVSDEAGNYRLAALPVGSYRFTAELQGFSRFDRPDVAVNIARTVTLDFTLTVAAVTETVNVTADTPNVSTRSSTVGEIVDVTRVQGLPLNGRQFANLAATVPGVGLGFHSETTKSAQYTPQISGGNGRNINYVVDGGDNNDDTVGGLLQLFPLEAIQEFNLMTHRFDAEYGRSNGGILNVVTKSGTNNLRGSWFTLGRDEAMNAQTTTEERTNTPKQDYSRYQFGGSFGGPVVRNKVHYFAAYERTQQDTKQRVTTPFDNGVYDVAFRQNLFTTKLTASPSSTGQYLALRYARDTNSQPSGAGPLATRSSWATSTNTYDSINGNHNWVLGQASLNEFVFQYSRFENDVPLEVAGPSFMFPNGVTSGASLTAPQRTEQTKWQLRDDFSTTTTRFGGLGHEFKAGVSWVHEPRLFVFTGQGTNGIFALGTLDPGGPVINVLVIGGQPFSNTKLDMYGLYVQDNWRASDRLTLNLGLRWDYVAGMPIDQSGSVNFAAMQAAGRTGRFAGTLLDDFGNDPRSDKDNLQPRIGFVYDLRGDARDIIRGGWGIYTDFGYINANGLVASLDANGGGIIFNALDPSGLRKADGSLFTATDDLSTIAHLNTIPAGSVGVAGEVVSPFLEQPYSMQTNLGWAHQLNTTTAVTADYVRVEGRDLHMRVRPNVLVDGRRVLAGIPIQPQNLNFRTALSKGSSHYDGLILALRRRMSDGLDLTASYTLADTTSDVGTAYDELAQNLIQDIGDPFGDVQQAPSARTDSRHQISISAIVAAPWDIQLAPIVIYRSGLPMHTSEGVDLNRDGNNNDKSLIAYRYTGLGDNGIATFEEDGPCATVNCSRRAPFSQMNLRVSRSFRLPGTARIEAIAEVFNLFNAKNPSIPITMRRVLANGTVNPSFMQPTAYAGDAGQPEQRVGQVGFRVSF